MSKDKFATELEREIFNWYYGGDNASPFPVFNSIRAGISNDMQMIVPIDIPEVLASQVKDPARLKPGDRITIDEDIHIGFQHLPARETGKYYIPLFTGYEELNKGSAASCINQSMTDLIGAIDRWPDCDGFIINPWDKKLILDKELIKFVLIYRPESQIAFVKGSVVDMRVSAIVNAANGTLLGGGGVDGAIHKAAGSRLKEECRALNGCNTGEAKITGAYDITNADYIIHTIGPIYSGAERDATDLANCYANSLTLAWENGCTSIAFPCISTGACGYPLDKAARIAMLSTEHWIRTHRKAVMNIYFCCFRDIEYDAFMDLD